MGRLIIVYGATASGKDTLMRYIEKEGVKRLMSYTTRPIRVGEEDGKEYHFVTKEMFDEDLANNMIIEHREYTVASGETWYYYFRKDSIDLSTNEDYCCIADLNGTLELINYYGKSNVVTIFLNTPPEMCIKRALDREPMELIKVKEICRRMISDIDDIILNPKSVEIADFTFPLLSGNQIYDICYDLGLYKSKFVDVETAEITYADGEFVSDQIGE